MELVQTQVADIDLDFTTDNRWAWSWIAWILPATEFVANLEKALLDSLFNARFQLLLRVIELQILSLEVLERIMPLITVSNFFTPVSWLSLNIFALLTLTFSITFLLLRPRLPLRVEFNCWDSALRLFWSDLRLSSFTWGWNCRATIVHFDLIWSGLVPLEWPVDGRLDLGRHFVLWYYRQHGRWSTFNLLILFWRSFSRWFLPRQLRVFCRF